VLLVAATFYAGELPAQAKPASTDVSITTQVENVIARDPFLRAMHIRVETQSGVVNLSGFVRSVDDIAKAGDLARGLGRVGRQERIARGEPAVAGMTAGSSRSYSSRTTA
jgi:osmotically-inducible protein OsmY